MFFLFRYIKKVARKVTQPIALILISAFKLFNYSKISLYRVCKTQKSYNKKATWFCAPNCFYFVKI
ncbi:hypothetical protein AGR56_16740 [Clostridium sp. DMHC 10]|nr:hypothetical protein AGR56_16740 [Clostridium sp. DMHC 10]